MMKIHPPANIEVYDATDREAWLVLRQRDVTASTVGALLGVHDYVTPLQLWALKSGSYQNNPEETEPMRRGRLLEPVALAVLREERPTWAVEAGSQYFRDPAARLGATPDAHVIDPARVGFGNFQVKSVEASVFRRKWRDAETGVITPPLWIVAQAIIEAHLTGASWAAVGALVVGFGLELHIVEVPIHTGIIEKIRTEVAAFWATVERGEAPPPDYGRDGAMIAQMCGEDDGTTVDLTGDNAIYGLRDEDAALAETIKAADGRRKEIKAEMLSKIGSAAILTVNGEIFATAKTTRRGGYTVAPTSYRTVRFKNDMPAVARGHSTSLPEKF